MTAKKKCSESWKETLPYKTPEVAATQALTTQ